MFIIKWGRHDIVWLRLFLIVIIHYAWVHYIHLRWNHLILPSTITFGKISAVITGLSITIGNHRLWTHAAFKTSRWFECVLMFLSSCVYENSVYEWVRDHRMHHKYSETDADPHNSKRGFFFAHCGWLMVKKHPEIRRLGHTLDMSDLEANPIVMFQHKYYYPIMFFTMFVLPVYIPIYFWGEKFIPSLTVQMAKYVMVLHFTWCVNSVAHLIGSKPYDQRIGSVQATLANMFTWGEGYHNYHHVYPYDYRASEFASDWLNLSTNSINLLALCGIIYERKTVPRETIKQRRLRSGDGTNHDGPGFVNTAWQLLWAAVLYFI